MGSAVILHFFGSLNRNVSWGTAISNFQVKIFFVFGRKMQLIKSSGVVVIWWKVKEVFW